MGDATAAAAAAAAAAVAVPRIRRACGLAPPVGPALRLAMRTSARSKGAT